MKIFKKISGKRMLLLLVIVTSLIGNTICMAAEIPNLITGTKNDEGLYPIMGTTSTCLSQMINYYESKATYPSFYASSDAPNIYTFCKIYLEECETEGVKAEVAFAQAMKETNFLKYGGDVDISQYNFAGIGATGNGNSGNSFSSVRIGIRAQVQHLKAYATSDSLVNEQVDPRYQYVNKGSAPYVQWLGKYENPSGIGWATAINYGYSIVNDYISVLLSASAYSTWYNGTNYADVYDPDYYMSYNPDVAASYGSSSDTLICHFINQGMAEGRIASESFNVNAYRSRYEDLRKAYGYTMPLYYYHYMQMGKAEGRIATGDIVTSYDGRDYSAVYDYAYYVDNNSDVAAAYSGNDAQTIIHFVNFGMKEGRRASESFDVRYYKQRYQDLSAAYDDDLKAYYIHYIDYGQREGRLAHEPVTTYNGVDYSAVYDYDYYLAANLDVAAAFTDDEAVLAHFVNYGMKEGRRANAAFDVRIYRQNYQDLSAAYGDNLQYYYLHYISYGQREGRLAHEPVTTYNGVDYSAVYNYKYYLAANPDVAAAYTDDALVLQHFVNFGMKEGRVASASFDVKSYRNAYRDLRAVYGSDLRQYYIHYIYYGRKEGRVATGVSEVQNAVTVYGTTDYSLVYDMNYYLAANPDVKNAYGTDENAVLAHFVNFGMKEGRQAEVAFNVYAYKAKYGDLTAAFGENLESYYYHYINNGYNEGRSCE